MMMAARLAAVGPRGPYLVVPVFAGLIVWTTFVLGTTNRRAWSWRRWATCSSSVSPIVLFQSLSPMTDVPIGALWTAAAAAALRRITSKSPALTGLIAAWP